MDDILNDARYTEILQLAAAGAYDTIHAAFPCVTTTVARCFDASGSGSDYGPRPLRDADHPDGLPRDQLSRAEYRELLTANRLADRMVEVLIAAHKSPRRTTICIENPSDRGIPGSPQHMADVSHGSFWGMSPFRRLREAIPNSSFATFANCRFDADSQKYITIWYTNDAAKIFDKLNGPDYQCNHPPGTHRAVAGGRDTHGFWLSTDTARYMLGFSTMLAMGFTFARTGDPSPLSMRVPKDDVAAEPVNRHDSAKDSDAPLLVPSPVTGGPDPAPEGTARDVTPRRLVFPPSSPGEESTSTRISSRPEHLRSISGAPQNYAMCNTVCYTRLLV